MHHARPTTIMSTRTLQRVELICFVEQLLAFTAFDVAFGPLDGGFRRGGGGGCGVGHLVGCN